MTQAEIKSGMPFLYKGQAYKADSYGTTTYSLSRADLHTHVANVREFGKTSMKCYTYILDKRVEVTVKYSDCVSVESKIKETELQEMQDEYGIGAYEEE